MQGALLLPLVYGLLGLFVLGFVYRSVRLARMPVHLRWELAPVPHEKGKGAYGGSYFEELDWWTKPREKSLLSELSYMGQEILFLKALHEHNRPLWWVSFPFHLGFYLLIGAGGLLVLAEALGLVGWARPGTGAWVVLPLALAAIGHGLGLVGTLGLLAKRGGDPHLRAYSTPESFLNLILALAVFATGAAAVAAPGFIAELRGAGLAVLTADVGVALPVALAAHVLAVALFLGWLPFSRMMHFVAKYFTYHQVRWDDEPMRGGSALEREVELLLQRPVRWSAPHIGGDGKRSWASVATEEKKT